MSSPFIPGGGGGSLPTIPGLPGLPGGWFNGPAPNPTLDQRAISLGWLPDSVRAWLNQLPTPQGTSAELLRPLESGPLRGLPAWMETRFREAGMTTGGLKDPWWMQLIQSPLSILTYGNVQNLARPWPAQPPAQPSPPPEGPNDGDNPYPSPGVGQADPQIPEDARRTIDLILAGLQGLPGVPPNFTATGWGLPNRETPPPEVAFNPNNPITAPPSVGGGFSWNPTQLTDLALGLVGAQPATFSTTVYDTPPLEVMFNPNTPVDRRAVQIGPPPANRGIIDPTRTLGIDPRITTQVGQPSTRRIDEPTRVGPRTTTPPDAEGGGSNREEKEKKKSSGGGLGALNFDGASGGAGLPGPNAPIVGSGPTQSLFALPNTKPVRVPTLMDLLQAMQLTGMRR